MKKIAGRSGGSLVKALVVSALLGASACVAHYLKPTLLLADSRQKVDFNQLVPENFAGWRVDSSLPIVVADPSALTLVNQIYTQTVSRTYVNDRGERIMLSIAYGANQSDALRLHLPEVCYAAQGFSILQRYSDTLVSADQSRPVTKVVAKANARLEPILYWVLVGDKVANSGLQQKIAQLRYGLNGQIPDGLLFRVSAIQNGGDPSFQLQARFISDLMTSMPQDKRKRLGGDDTQYGARS